MFMESVRGERSEVRFFCGDGGRWEIRRTKCSGTTADIVVGSVIEIEMEGYERSFRTVGGFVRAVAVGYILNHQKLAYITPREPPLPQLHAQETPLTLRKKASNKFQTHA